MLKLTKRNMSPAATGFKSSVLQAVSPGFNAWQEQKFSGIKKNQEGVNFLRSFIGSGALNFSDDTGSIQLDPRTGAFSATPKNPQGWGFAINPLMQSASIRKGPFELSGGLNNAPLNMAPGYGPTNKEQMNAFTDPKQKPWGMIGFKFGGRPQAETQPNTPSYEEQQSGVRAFASPEVEKLLTKVTSPYYSGADKYDPATW
jgi:hypothetical protein